MSWGPLRGLGVLGGPRGTLLAWGLVLSWGGAEAAASVLVEGSGGSMGCRLAGRRDGDGAERAVLDGGVLGRGGGAVHVGRCWLGDSCSRGVALRLL